MALKFCLLCAIIGCVQGTKLSHLENVVYVSKVRGQAKSDLCGTKSLPCKSLQDGINKLQWDGKLFIDGENTAINPYTCESSAGKLVVKTKIAIQSYTTTAHISCKHGFILMAEDRNPGMNVTIFGLQLKNTMLYLRNVNATIEKCVFLESSPAITVMNSQSLPLYSLDIENSVFKRNHGCIDLMQTRADSNQTACSRLLLDLKNIIFQANAALRDDAAKGGLVFVNHTGCFCKKVSFLSTWYNITLIDNQGKAAKSLDRDQRMQNVKGNSAKSFKGKRIKYDQILDSVFVVYTCSANITLNRITSDYNKNMRFLGLRCCHSDVQIYKCCFHRHIIGSPGGVVYIPMGEFTSVIIKDSDFSRNMGSIGGVLQVDGGAKKTVIVKLFNVNFLYCTGNITGCAVSIGNVEKRGVDKVFAILRGVLFNQCHNKIKRGSGRNKQGPLCLRGTNVTSVSISNSTFLGNKNRKTAAVNIVHSPTTNTDSSVDVQIKRTIFEQNACDTNKPTLGIFIVNPSQVKRSRLIISHSVFVRNRGTVISVDNFQDIKVINMTCSYSKGLCYDFYIGKRKKLKNTPPGLNASCLIKDSTFFRNYRSFNVKYVQPNFIDIKLRNITILENTGSNLALFQFGSRRLQNLSITGTVLFDRLFFISNSKSVGSKADQLFGVVVPESHDGNITFIFRKCVFQNNFHRNAKTRDHIPEMLFFFQLPGDQAVNRSSSCSRFPSYDYKNSFIFEDVVFENNTGPSFVSYIANGKSFFINCLFKNNYSFKPKTGAHLFIQEGNSSVEFRNTNFIQTNRKPKISSNNISSTLFVFAGARGPLLLRNSNFIANDSSTRVIPHFTIQTEGYVHIDNSTKLLCPVGSYMDVEDGSHLIHQGSASGCINITQLKFICKMCGVGKYSLERGSYQQKSLQHITCLEFCPFGAECTWNIQSRPNFWGYSTTANNPPQLNFTRCPENYCRVPKSKTNTSIYNRCSGNRTGLMCGACKKGFTESMFNHKCRPEKECRDGWFWVVAGLFSVIMAGYLLCKPPIVLYLKNNLIWFRQKTQSMPHRTCEFEQIETRDSHSGHGYSKIIFYFYQVADLLMLESSTEILHKHIFISSVISIYNFKFEVADSSFGCPFPGLTAVTKELFRCLHVFVVMVVLVVLYILHSLVWLIRGRPRPYFAPYLAAIVEVLLLGYERLGHTSLKLLNCVPLTLHGHEEWRLVLDGNITCWVHWWQYAMIAYNMVFVIPFLLVLLVGTLKLERQKISALQFVAACFLPLPFLMCWMFKRCLRNHSAYCKGTPHESTQSEEKRKALLGILQGPFRLSDNESRGASYWESILIGRRLVFLCMYSFISTPMLRMLLMTAVSVVILVHNIVVKPYKDKRAHLFGVIMLSIHVALAIINLCKSVLITVGVTPTGPTKAQINGLQFFEVTLLGILPLIFLLLIVLTLLSQIIRIFVFVIRFFVRSSKGEVRLFAKMNKRDNDCYRPLLVPCEEEESLACSTGSEAQENDVLR